MILMTIIKDLSLYYKVNINIDWLAKLIPSIIPDQYFSLK